MKLSEVLNMVTIEIIIKMIVAIYIQGKGEKYRLVLGSKSFHPLEEAEGLFQSIALLDLKADFLYKETEYAR